MSSLVKCFVIMIFPVFLMSCVSVQNISYDKVNRPPLQTIALLKVSESNYYQVRNFSGTALMAGAIGGAIQAKTDQNRSIEFVQALNNNNIKLGAIMVEKLGKEFKNNGVIMTYLPDSAPVIASDGTSDDYSHISTDADAILNIWFGAVGFANTKKTSLDFQPWLVANVRLLDAKSKAILYQKTFNVGYEAKIANAAFLKMEPAYQFGNFDDLMGRFNDAVVALTKCEHMIVKRIAEDLI